MGSTLKKNERAFIAWMAPRGIVAAATSSTFALGLSKAGIGGGSEKLIRLVSWSSSPLPLSMDSLAAALRRY